MICTPHQILSAWSNHEGCDGQGMWCVCGRRKMHTGCWWGNI